MQPLYRAVIHGCLAEEYEQALNMVYKGRILRMDNRGFVKYYSRHQLNAYSQDLTILSVFFPLGWLKLSKTGLSETEQIWLLVDISFCLMSLGRIQEAIAPRIIGVKFYEKSKSWEFASTCVQILVSLYLPLGQLKQATEAAQEAIKYALFADVMNQYAISSSYLATVLHRKGELNEAHGHFQEAESILRLMSYEYHPSLSGFWYCNLLLDSSTDNTIYSEVILRAKYSLQNCTSSVDKALNNLTLARVHAAINLSAEYYFAQAVDKIQKVNKIESTPPFYLYRADFYLTQNQLDPALADLNSAWEIIERCGMKLYAVDYLLIHGRYSLATADFETALSHYEEAKNLIQETGYHLRDAELDLFAAQLRGQCSEAYRHLVIHNLPNPVSYAIFSNQGQEGKWSG
ncbi:hypothetical protein [Methylomicrobium lacus]|uniref:hypothetical protein n=1 Tax=Methylomicrobium lacus TaxID=136992 RepID=UPI0035A9998E